MAKAQWEELRPLPVRAASAANKLASAEERVQKQAGVLKKLQDQIDLAEAEMIRQQAQLATARLHSDDLQAQLAAATPPPAPPQRRRRPPRRRETSKKSPPTWWPRPRS